MQSEQEIRDRLADLRDHDEEYDEFEEGGEAVEAEERGYVEALEWVLEEADRGPA
jgi:hypothetical protein